MIDIKYVYIMFKVILLKSTISFSHCIKYATNCS